MERLTKGTIEYLIIKVTDTLNNLTVIPSATYDIYTGDDAATEVIVGQDAIIEGMLVMPMVDTTNMDEGPYDLYITFPATPETPRLGPFRFRVDD